MAWHNFIILPIQTKLFNQSYNLPERFHLDRLTVQKLKQIASSLEFSRAAVTAFDLFVLHGITARRSHMDLVQAEIK
jgi:cob(I)alamin adenosyltransferase